MDESLHETIRPLRLYSTAGLRESAEVPAAAPKVVMTTMQRNVRAEAWCSLNGWRWPWGGDESESEVGRGAIKFAFSRFTKRDTEAGLRLWKKRMRAGLDPVTGARG